MQFLIPHAGNPTMLAASITSVLEHHVNPYIIICLRGGDPYLDRARDLADLYDCDYVVLPGNDDITDEVMITLFERANSQWICYMEADCLLLKNIEELCDYPFSGVEDYIKWPEGRPGKPMGPEQAHFRFSPGMYSASFFVLDLDYYKEHFGLGTIRGGRAYGQEPYMGLSHTLVENNVPRRALAVKHLPPEFGFATAYEDYVVHMWFGAWRCRDNIESASGVTKHYMSVAENHLLHAYWEGWLREAVCMTQ